MGEIKNIINKSSRHRGQQLQEKLEQYLADDEKKSPQVELYSILHHICSYLYAYI